MAELDGTSAADAYLQATRFCDVHSPEIQELARNLRSLSSSDEEFARNCFLYVRDQIRFRIGINFSSAASETLALGEGSCSSKCNLLVALIRAGGMQAGFHEVRLISSECFPLFPEWLLDLFKPESIHFFCAIALDGKWVRVDPSIDTGWFAAATHLGEFRMEWNGASDATPEDWGISRVLPRVATIDNHMTKGPRSEMQQTAELAQAVCDFIREYAPLCRTHQNYRDAVEAFLLGLLPDVFELPLLKARVAGKLSEEIKNDAWYHLGMMKRISKSIAHVSKL